MDRLAQAARDAVLAAYRGRRVSCGRAHYVKAVRKRLVEACRYLYDDGDEDRSAHLMAEVLRLDAEFDYHPRKETAA